MYEFLLNSANELMNTITAGTYPVRPVLFVGYMLGVLVTVWLVRWLPARTRLLKISGISRRTISVVAISLVSLLFLTNVILQFAVFNYFGIPERSVAIGIQNGEITETRFAHIHFGKVVIASILKGPTQDLILRADTGRALLPYVPQAVVVVESILFVIALLFSLLSAGQYVQPISGKGRQLSALLLLGLLGFYVLEKSLDGGIVSDGAGLALLTWAFLLLMPLHRFAKLIPYMVFGYTAVLLCLYIGGWYWPTSYALLALERTGVLALLILTGAYFLRDMRRAAALAGGIALVGVALFIYHNDASDRDYMSRRIAPDAFYLAAYPEEAKPSLPKVGGIGDLNVYDASSLAPRTVNDVLEQYQLPAAYRPLTPGSYTCSAPALLREERFSVLSPKRLVAVRSDSGLFSLTVTPEYPAPRGWYRYHAVLFYNPCIPRYLDVLEQGIVSAGSDTALVYGLELYVTPNTAR